MLACMNIMNEGMRIWDPENSKCNFYSGIKKSKKEKKNGITKIIACADIHFQNLKGIEELKEVLEGFVKQCEDIIKEEESPENVRIVVAGDVFESKISITNEAQLAVDWFFRKLDNLCKTIVIAGNHDLAINNLQRIDSLSTIFNIGNYKNIIYLDKELSYNSGCYVDNNVVWCLYSSFSSFATPDIKSMKIKYPNHIYIGLIHGEVNGATTATNHVTENKLDANIFEECEFVIAGHIHKKQEIKKNGVKVVYCSSITQKDFGENVSEHGFVLWELGNDITYKFIDVKNDDGGYYKIAINSIEDIDNDLEEFMNL
jgi:DNA repair exonuclease SbcCD nuclease subunit